MDEVLHDLLAPLGVPVLAGLPIGHGAHNHAFRLGTAARIRGNTLELDA
jgi:muramoyltetrapeptide carboxypeptidase